MTHVVFQCKVGHLVPGHEIATCVVRKSTYKSRGSVGRGPFIMNTQMSRNIYPLTFVALFAHFHFVNAWFRVACTTPLVQGTYN